MGPTNVVNNDIVKILGKIAINPCGDFDAARNYERLDLVSYKGGTYLCIKKPTENELPTDEGHWMIMTKDGIGVDGARGYQGYQGEQGFQGYQGEQGTLGATGDIWMPEYNNSTGKITWTRKTHTDSSIPESADIRPSSVSYGYTTAAEPEIGKNETFESFKTKNPKPKGTIISLASAGKATDDKPYIWKISKTSDGGEKIEIYDAVYPNLQEIIGESIASVVIGQSMTYGAIVIDTDLSWSVFKTGNGGPGWTHSDGIQFNPAVVIDPTNGTDTDHMSSGKTTDTFEMTMERWERNSKVRKLTNQDALHQIYTAISNPASEYGFLWETFYNFYCKGSGGSTVPYIPFTLKFTNGLFTIQDMHDCTIDSNGVLTNVALYGSLTIYNSANAFMQESHVHRHKYRLDCGIKIRLNSSKSSCSMKLYSGTREQYDTGDPFVVLTLLPLAA